MVNISPLRATNRVTRAQTLAKAKAQDDTHSAAQGDSSATKSSNNINRTAATPLGAFELRSIITPKAGNGLKPPSALVLLRCRQLQRFCEALSNGPSELRSKRALVTPEHLARAHLAQPNFREKLIAAEADWEDTWVHRTKSLTGFLNSPSFKSLPLPEGWHEQQRKEAQEEEAAHVQNNERHSPTTTGVQELQEVASDFSKQDHGILYPDDTSIKQSEVFHMGYESWTLQQRQEEGNKISENNQQQQQKKPDSGMSFSRRQSRPKLPESSLVSFASRPKSAASNSQGEDMNLKLPPRQQPVARNYFQQPRMAPLRAYSNGKSNTGTTADTSIGPVQSLSSPSDAQTSLPTPTRETITGRSESSSGSGSGSGRGSELNSSPTQESNVRWLQRRVAIDMEARIKASRAEKKNAMGTFEEKDTYTQQDWECFRLWKQEEAKRKAAKRTEKKDKMAATRDALKDT